MPLSTCLPKGQHIILSPPQEQEKPKQRKKNKKLNKQLSYHGAILEVGTIKGNQVQSQKMKSVLEEENNEDKETMQGFRDEVQ